MSEWTSPGLHVPLHETHQIVVMLTLNLVDDRYVRGAAIEPQAPLDVFRELTLMMPPLPSKLGLIEGLAKLGRVIL